ncbi:MAG: RHS repeat-associated core domain-containing protein, partial [Parabacteroides sp.]|nr:RHS repeat-associated core domain-containing protein [Parabacteroides sp.]
EVFCSVGDMAKVNPFQFSTKYTDSETDLVYYGYRYYSPALGRWMSRDPIEEKGGLNLYGFYNNDPINKSDVLGNVPYFQIIAVGNSINNGILACYNCYHFNKCIDRVIQYADKRRKYYEKDPEKYYEWLMIAKPGQECSPLAAECGVRAIKVVVWLGSRYLVLKYYAGGHY